MYLIRSSCLSIQNINNRLVRFDELIPNKTAFIDARTPGSDQKDNYCIIGEGVSENPDQHVHILDNKGFNVGAAGQPAGIKNSLHSHTSAEIFIIYSGQFRLYWGNDGQFEAILKPGDMISIPTNCFRGFEVVGDEYGFLFAFLGGDDSGGGVTWHPDVIKTAESYGLVLLEDGTLVDTVEGHTVPEDKKKMPPLDKNQLDRFNNYPVEEMSKFIIKKGDYSATSKPFMNGAFKQYNLSGSENNDYDFQVKSEDGLCVFAYEMEEGGMVPMHKRTEHEALINVEGETLLTLQHKGKTENILLKAGDTFNLPLSAAYQLQCVGKRSFVYSAVQGNSPSKPEAVYNDEVIPIPV